MEKSETGQYVLGEDGRTPVPSGGREWSEWFAKASRDGATGRRVARTELGVAVVSTVFLGIDHDFSGTGDPVLFETLVMGGEHDGWQNRYTSWTLAEIGHAWAVAMVKGGLVTIEDEDEVPEPEPEPPEARVYRGAEVTLSIAGMEMAFRSEMMRCDLERLKVPAETLSQMATRFYTGMSREALFARRFAEWLPPRRQGESDADYAKRFAAWLSGMPSV